MRSILLILSMLYLSACGFSGYGVRKVEQLGPIQHRVQAGESLWSISKRYGVSERTLVRLNGLQNANKLRAGELLLVGYRSAPQLRNAYIRSEPPENSQQYRGKRRLNLPIRRGRLVSKFGPRSRSFHDGIDLAAPSGTPVYAAHTGEVMYAGSRLRGYGKLVLIRGDDRLITVYAHNRRLHVRKGDRVRVGQRIAEVGSTGRSTGPHLHFEVRMKDRDGRLVAIDPLPILRASGRKPRYRVNESLSPLLVKR